MATTAQVAHLVERDGRGIRKDRRAARRHGIDVKGPLTADERRILKGPFPPLMVRVVVPPERTTDEIVGAADVFR